MYVATAWLQHNLQGCIACRNWKARTWSQTLVPEPNAHMLQTLPQRVDALAHGQEGTTPQQTQSQHSACTNMTAEQVTPQRPHSSKRVLPFVVQCLPDTCRTARPGHSHLGPSMLTTEENQSLSSSRPRPEMMYTVLRASAHSPRSTRNTSSVGRASGLASYIPVCRCDVSVPS